MTTGAILLVALVGYSVAQITQKSCGKNEQYTTCGTACEPSCDKPDPGFCTLQCVIGCQCKPTFLRNSKGQCVARNQCNVRGITKRTPTCATIDCREGYVCVENTINCIRAPCPQPPPRCVPAKSTSPRTPRSSNPCDNHPCPAGQKCHLQEVQCIRAPCPPIPVCN